MPGDDKVLSGKELWDALMPKLTEEQRRLLSHHEIVYGKCFVKTFADPDRFEVIHPLLYETMRGDQDAQ